MLASILQSEHIQVADHVADWQTAIRQAAQPLLDDGYFESKYVDDMIESVEGLGPYIVIAPEIALAHARPQPYVHHVGLSLLKLTHAVHFSDGGHPASLIFVLSAVDEKAHLVLLQKLSKVLGDKEKVAQLREATEVAQIINVIKGEVEK